ncbi:cytochrome c3 family protein [Zooshikella sp. RANM57]|uniref:cytochrome c3 family protein n=1 Tax=Zooshikella sp. RANM57 TaxID=3425863 RepID=UPI003D6E0AFC
MIADLCYFVRFWQLHASFCTAVLLILCPVLSFAQTYIGDNKCRECHSDIYSSYIKTGHPHKIQKVTGPPVFPADTSPGVPSPPADKQWNDISYVIGGFAWKARFMDKEGYILTGDKHRQFNLANQILKTTSSWTGYDKDNAPRKPYTCGECHTTGWVLTGPKGPHQNNLPGIYGVWSADGVTCEACHGPGDQHAAQPEQVHLSFEENCGDCHRRGNVSQIDASNGLIRHHEQYEDLLASPHRNIKCIACHEPHQSVKYQGNGFKGEQNTCQICHTETIDHIPAKVDFQCTTCHMPRIAKSAVSVKHQAKIGEIPEGDVRGHIFRISTDQQWKMFTNNGQFVRLNDEGKAFITVDYACLICHTDKDKAWAIEFAKRIHQ